MIQNSNDGYKAYIKYLAIKKHFTSDFDYFKYNGKVKASIDSFLKRKDKYFFLKIEKKYKDAELVEYFVSNFIEDEKTWIGSLAGDVGQEVFVNWKKKHSSLTKYFKDTFSDLCFEILKNEEKIDVGLRKILISKNGQHPKILQLYMMKQIDIDFLILLNVCTGIFKHWNKELSNDPIWQIEFKKIQKYRPFISFDDKRIKQIFKEILDE